MCCSTGAKTPNGARRYCMISGGLYLLLTGVGLVFPDTFGFIPIGGYDIVLHAVFGIILTIVGATAPEEVPAGVQA